MHNTTSRVVVATIIVLCSFVQNTTGGDASCPAVAQAASSSLREDLFCNYDPNVRPVKNQAVATNISIQLMFQSLDFEEKFFNIYGQMVYEWTDEFLKWNTSDYGGRDTISVASSDIWVPDIDVYTTSDMKNSQPQLDNLNCMMNNSGEVRCVWAGTLNARCSPDLTRWPFDEHNCTMSMGSWSYTGNEMNISLSKEANYTDYYYSAIRDWNLESSGGECRVLVIGNNTYHSLHFNFVVRRHARGHVATVIVPALVLVTMTLMIFSINAGAPERLCLICFIILLHCVFLQYLGKNMPRNGTKTPLIVLFFRDSLLMVGGSLLISLLVRRMHQASSAPPAWAVALVSNVQATLPGQVFMFSIMEDRKQTMRAEMDSSDTLPGWDLFASIVDRLTLIAFCITFLVLLIALIP